MNIALSCSIICFAPLLAAVAAGLVLPDQVRLYGVIAAYLLVSVVAVSVAAEQYHGRIRSSGDMLVAVRSGAQGALWIGLAVGGVITVAWLAAQIT